MYHLPDFPRQRRLQNHPVDAVNSLHQSSSHNDGIPTRSRHELSREQARQINRYGQARQYHAPSPHGENQNHGAERLKSPRSPRASEPPPPQFQAVRSANPKLLYQTSSPLHSSSNDATLPPLIGILPLAFPQRHSTLSAK